MIDGHVSQTKIEDLKPTWLPFAFLCITALLWAGAFMGILEHPVLHSQRYMLAGVLTYGFALMLGGPAKLLTDWRDRNFHGYFWVLWQTGPNQLKGHFVNRKNLSNVTMTGWSLYLPVGGWFNRPFLSHHEGGLSRNFRITHVRWNDFGAVKEVTVKDNAGGKITMYPTTIIGHLERVFPASDSGHPWTNGLLELWENDKERARRASLKVVEELSKTQNRLATLRLAVGEAIGTMSQLAAAVGASDRLKNTKEGRAILNRLTQSEIELRGRTYAAISSTTENGALAIEPNGNPTRTGLSGFA